MKIAISTNKGGVLKTSITTNLAGVMAKKKKKVLIIDTDNQGNVLLSFGRNPDECDISLYDVLVNSEDAKKAIINVHKYIDVLPSNDDMSFFEFDVIGKIKSPFGLLGESIREIENEYDFILFDTPPNLGLTQGNVLLCADRVIIPFQPEQYSMRSLVKIVKAIHDFKETHNPNLSILGVVATLVDLRTVLHTEVIQECRKYCNMNEITMFQTVIKRSVRFASSIAYDRLPITLANEKHETSQYYYELYKEVLQQ